MLFGLIDYVSGGTFEKDGKDGDGTLCHHTDLRVFGKIIPWITEYERENGSRSVYYSHPTAEKWLTVLKVTEIIEALAVMLVGTALVDPIARLLKKGSKIISPHGKWNSKGFLCEGSTTELRTPFWNVLQQKIETTYAQPKCTSNPDSYVRDTQERIQKGEECPKKEVVTKYNIFGKPSRVKTTEYDGGNVTITITNGKGRVLSTKHKENIAGGYRIENRDPDKKLTRVEVVKNGKKVVMAPKKGLQNRLSVISKEESPERREAIAKIHQIAEKERSPKKRGRKIRNYVRRRARDIRS